MTQDILNLRKKPVVLLILDGVGHGIKAKDNAISNAKTPNWDDLVKNYAYGTIDASEKMVGLPEGQFGNSEVGHLNIGAGRIVGQDITRINESIEEDTLIQNPVIQELISQKNRTVHLIGLFSDGGVHSHIEHFFAILDILVQSELEKIVVHPFLDGRDTPPQSAKPYLERLEKYTQLHPQVKVGSVAGRFYAMDRDNRWERVEKAYNALVGVNTPTNSDSISALKEAYERGENDEFVTPTIIDSNALINDGDAVLFLNFRADRARELLRTLTEKDFNEFTRIKAPELSYVASMTKYGAMFNCPVMFPPQSLKNGLGEYVSDKGLRQLRIAETEKYPHVTYFFSGGREQPYPNEERILIPSPKVKTYDLKPEMSAYEVTDKIIESVRNDAFELIICNFANGDMVGHTGNLSASIKAIETLDKCIGRIADAVLSKGGELLITADHGNCEKMHDEKNNQPHTQHTTNPVPFLYIGEKATIKSGGALKDIAPTLLAMLGLEKPVEMTGENLIEFIQ
ncbi:2,3-bisphosphoglycerate-independent phosphoglycerate mutase [Neisseriaceae bacterium PsAf]|nr:2,3-bisphosphoglycerate-independent phosphoglycerate mutase [Neisseriaceae bacterium PsAf]MCV2503612.1 2,3-bisphosphoglycerate-independent phosphoglycerate mutase [Neisseriaceae bacterium]